MSLSLATLVPEGVDESDYWRDEAIKIARRRLGQVTEANRDSNMTVLAREFLRALGLLEAQ